MSPAETRPARAAAAARSIDDHGSRVGADEALATLVGQFADPMVFLRELVQNSLDAASTQIDIELACDEGVISIAVIDNGEGMTETIIDDYLLTLFSSTKEDDLTKIGKFGVGFVSIFAIGPELVVVDTGAAGESWRVLFHADRSFEKIRLDDPVEGTTVTLHKPGTNSELETLRARAAHIVRHWCKYADAALTVDGASINEPFGIDAALTVVHDEPGTKLCVGFAPPAGATPDDDAPPASRLAPLCGYYNRGLTLLEGAAPPDERSADLAGLSLRITSRYLEHTLTRDNVRQDEHYDKAMALLRQCVDERLRPALLAHLEAFAAHYSGTGSREAPGMPSYADALLYARLPSMRLPAVARHRPLLPSVEGGALSVRDLERADSPTGVMLCTAAASPLTARLARDGVPVLLDRPGTVVFARACGVEVTPAHARLFTAEPVEVEGDGVAAMLRRAQALLDGVKLRVSRVVLGDFEYGLSCVSGRLHVRQREAFGVTRLGDDDTPTLFGGARDVVVSARHPVAVECIALAASDPALAATILAQAIAVGEKVAHDRHADLAAAGARARASGGQDT